MDAAATASADRRASRGPIPVLRSLVLAALLVVAACGSDDERPSADAWRPGWEDAKALVPPVATVVGDDGEEACGAALGELRAAREDLLPSPRAVLDGSVGEWLSSAEGLMLDCPDDVAEAEERVDDLAVLAAEVDGGLTASG